MLSKDQTVFIFFPLRRKELVVSLSPCALGDPGFVLNPVAILILIVPWKSRDS